MTKEKFLASLESKDPRKLNSAIQRHRIKIETMTDEQFAVHYAGLEARKNTKAVRDTVQRLAKQFSKKAFQ